MSGTGFGLRPCRTLSGLHTQVNSYAHASGDGTALFIGDAVVTNHTSTSAVVNIPDGTPIVTLVSDNGGAGTTADLRGAVVGVRPTFSNLTLQYCPASVNLEVLVADDPFSVFQIMSDGTGTSASVGATAKLVNGTGSTTTGLSGGQLHQSGIGQSHFTLHVIRLAPIQGNAFAANSIFEVKINNHELLDTSGDV